MVARHGTKLAGCRFAPKPPYPQAVHHRSWRDTKAGELSLRMEWNADWTVPRAAPDRERPEAARQRRLVFAQPPIAGPAALDKGGS